LPAEAARLRALAERLAAAIVTVAPGARIAGHAAVRAPHVLDVAFPGEAGESLVTALDLEGVAVSAGSACAAGASEPSHVLLAMGWTRDDAASAVRFSLGWGSADADVDGIAAALRRVLARTRARAESRWQAHAS
jgi:cysteine desulfurase